MSVFDEIKAGQTADKIQKSINLDKLGCDAKQFFSKSEIEIIEKSMTKPISEDIQKSMDLIEKAVEIGVLSEDDIQKAKYIRREGTKGNYKYIYDEPKGGGSKKEEKPEMMDFRKEAGLPPKKKEYYQMTKKEYKNSDSEDSEAYHRNGIVNALRNGKSVPEEVLKEYPELKDSLKKKEESKIPIRELEDKAPNEMSFKDYLRLKGSQGSFHGSESEKDNLEREWNKAQNKGDKKNEWNITDSKEVLKRTKELNNLKVKRSDLLKDSYAYKNVDKQIKQLESMMINDKDGNTVGWKKFDNED